MIPVTASVSVEIFDDEPWRHCVEADSIQRAAQVCPRVISMTSGISLALSHQRMAVNAGPAGAGQGRQPAKPGARKARALTGVGWSGSASPGATAGQRQVGAAPLLHCADMLSAMENSDFRKVRPCQKSCNKPLHLHTTDRGAPCALYPAIKRSVVCASPVLRYPSPNRHRTKTRTSRTRAGCTRIWRS
jgi:hypothetical protein